MTNPTSWPGNAVTLTAGLLDAPPGSQVRVNLNLFAPTTGDGNPDSGRVELTSYLVDTPATGGA